ncbi:type II toxin-antitoxin system VapC family toxin [Rhizobium sp. TRM95796]|uniref:type II toxin-antitoxin system VapC family toxin n=1 Tax=Rhizobium sp. TRM95796 TaxID=2979862 RepID=UPI0021E6F9ED|nr:hypothetical protein [Rhizobium sp. TRM95796]MCV3765557.1 hypothetical protein [Rhizobium sp. TRM95796]
MASYLPDTHVWAWDLKIDRQPPARIVALIDDADDVFVSVISFYEIAQEARLGKWSSMAPVVAEGPSALKRQNGKILDLTSP